MGDSPGLSKSQAFHTSAEGEDAGKGLRELQAEVLKRRRKSQAGVSARDWGVQQQGQSGPCEDRSLPCCVLACASCWEAVLGKASCLLIRDRRLQAKALP